MSTHTNNVAIERCICQLSYFYLMSLCPDQSERQIKFQRHILKQRETIDWMSLDDKLVNCSNSEMFTITTWKTPTRQYLLILPIDLYILGV